MRIPCLFSSEALLYIEHVHMVKHYATLPLTIREHFLRAKRGEAELIYERGGLSSPLRSAQDATAAERVHLRLSQRSGWSVYFPFGAFWLICGSEFHDVLELFRA